MYVQTQSLTLSTTLVDALLAALSARPAAALLTTPTVHLFTATSTPLSPSSATTDFTEATFPGYAAVVMGTLLGPVNLPNRDGRGLHVECDYLAGAITYPGETILGYWIDDGATAFYGGEVFADPITLVNPGDFLSLDLMWPSLTPAAVV